MQTADVVPFGYDRRFSDKMVWAKVKSLVPPEHEDEIWDKIRAGTNMYLLIQECQRRFGGQPHGQ